MPRLFIVFVAYGSAASSNAHRYLSQLARRLQPSALVVVDNAGAAAAWQLAGVTAIDGDNLLREFSGWDSGVAWLRQHHGLCNSDWLLCINDTVCRQSHLRWLTLGRGVRLVKLVMRSQPIGVPQVVGPLVWSAMGEPGPTGNAARRHLATYFFLMPHALYTDIGGLGVSQPWHVLLGNAWPQPLFQLPEDPNRNRLYNTWLGVDQAGGRGQWPGSQARPFSAENYEFLRAKAQCILLEQRLSAAIAARSAVANWALDLYPQALWSRLVSRVLQRLERLVA